jgi:hypothetical protein
MEPPTWQYICRNIHNCHQQPQSLGLLSCSNLQLEQTGCFRYHNGKLIVSGRSHTLCGVSTHSSTHRGSKRAGLLLTLPSPVPIIHPPDISITKSSLGKCSIHINSDKKTYLYVLTPEVEKHLK